MLHTGISDTHYMCAETKTELLRLENGWHRATYNAVTRLGVMFYLIDNHLIYWSTNLLKMQFKLL